MGGSASLWTSNSERGAARAVSPVPGAPPGITRPPPRAPPGGAQVVGRVSGGEAVLDEINALQTGPDDAPVKARPPSTALASAPGFLAWAARRRTGAHVPARCRRPFAAHGIPVRARSG